MSDAKKYPKPVDDGGTDHIRPGTPLPAVRLRSTDGTDICLADHKGRLVLFVYPWTGRPDQPDPPHWDEIPGAHGSTPEIEGFRHLVGEFAEFEIALFGMSNQKPDYQREMVERLNVPFPILSDANGKFAKALGLPSFETGGMNFLIRTLHRCLRRQHRDRVLSGEEAGDTCARCAEMVPAGDQALAVRGQRTSSSASSTE